MNLKCYNERLKKLDYETYFLFDCWFGVLAKDHNLILNIKS